MQIVYILGCVICTWHGSMSQLTDCTESYILCTPDNMNIYCMCAQGMMQICAFCQLPIGPESYISLTQVQACTYRLYYTIHYTAGRPKNGF